MNKDCARIRQEEGSAYGLTHLTRTNMPGSGHEDIYGGVRQTYRRYVAEAGIDYYDADPANVTTHIISAVGRETARIRFSTTDSIDAVMPGWAQDGLIANASDPNWRPGMAVVNPLNQEYAVLYRDYPEQINRHVYGAAKDLGVTDVRATDVLDPGMPQGGIIHSSADRARNAEDGDTTFVGAIGDRDLYAVVLKPLVGRPDAVNLPAFSADTRAR